MINGETGASSEPLQQLALIQAKGERAVLALYPLLEEYLSILKVQLESAVFQATFQLVTQHQPENFNNLNEVVRWKIRTRLRWLCGRCSSFLNVEQLLQLAIKLQKHDPEPQLLENEVVESNLPPGSISLSLELAPLMDGFNPRDFSQNNQEDEENLPATFKVIQQMLAAASFKRASHLKHSFPMPHEPLALHRWLMAWDFALERRLRNLSNAVNVELHRRGLIRNVLPIALLDAVQEGSADVLAAPANLIAITLPYPIGSSEDFSLHGLLLRSSDMEYLYPSLRSIRARINQINSKLLRMARRAQHWEQQLATRKAEQQWIKDSRQDETLIS